MRAKVILTWNIKPGKEQFYYGFMVGDYLPKVNSLGLELTDAWVTVYGDEPQRLPRYDVVVRREQPDHPVAALAILPRLLIIFLGNFFRILVLQF